MSFMFSIIVNACKYDCCKLWNNTGRHVTGYANNFTQHRGW